MATDGKKEVATRRPAFPDFDDLRDLFRFETRWPFGAAFPRAFRVMEREMAAIDVLSGTGAWS